MTKREYYSPPRLARAFGADGETGECVAVTIIEVQTHFSSMAGMQLGYSFRDIEPVWFKGYLPFPGLTVTEAKVSISGTSHGRFPAFLSRGTLIAYHRPAQGVTGLILQLAYQYGISPPLEKPAPMGEFYVPPGELLFAFIRIALTPDSFGAITKIADKHIEYEVKLENVMLIDQTPRRPVVSQ